MFIGIDPGNTGAVAFVENKEFTNVVDMPLVTVRNRTELDLVSLKQILVDNLKEGSHVVLEKVGVMPKQGVASSGAFMRAFGMIEGLIVGLGLPYTLVIPRTWKKQMLPGLDTSSKDSSRYRVMQMFPDHAKLFMRKKDDGRAEAVLLALYGEHEATS